MTVSYVHLMVFWAMLQIYVSRLVAQLDNNRQTVIMSLMDVSGCGQIRGQCYLDRGGLHHSHLDRSWQIDKHCLRVVTRQLLSECGQQSVNIGCRSGERDLISCRQTSRRERKTIVVTEVLVWRGRGWYTPWGSTMTSVMVNLGGKRDGAWVKWNLEVTPHEGGSTRSYLWIGDTKQGLGLGD